MSAVIKTQFSPRVRLEEGQIVRDSLLQKNARNVGAWWSRFAGGIHCADPRNKDQQMRGWRLSVRMRTAAVIAERIRERKEAEIRDEKRKRFDLNDAFSNVLFFKRQAD